MGAAAATATAGGQGGVYQDRYGGYWEMDCGYYFSGSTYWDGAYQGTNGIGVYSCFNGCANRPGCVGFTYYGTSTGPTTGGGRCFHFYNGQQGNLNYNTTYLYPDAGTYSLFGSAYLLQASENLLCPTYNGTYFLDAQRQAYYILCGYGSTSQYQNTAARDGPACLALCDAQAQCIGVTVVYGGAESNANNNANCYLASAGLNTIADRRNVLAVRTTMPSFVPTTTTTTTTTSSATSAAASSAAASSTCTFAVSPTGLPTNCGGRSSTASFLGVYNDTCGVTYSIYCHVESNPQQADTASASSISACMALCDNYVFADNSTCQSATLYQGRCYLKRSFDGFRDANTDTTVMVRNSNQNLLLANSSSTTASPTTSAATVPYSTTLSAYTSYQPTNTWTINSGSCASGMGPAVAVAAAGGQGGVYTDIYNSYWEMDCDYAFSGADNYDGATTGSGTGSLGVYGCFNGCAQRPNCIGFSYYGTQSEPARGAGRCYFYGAGQQGDLVYSPTAVAPQATTTPIYGSSYLIQGSPVNMCPYWNNQYYIDSSNVTYYIICGSDGTGNQTYDGSLQTSYTGTSYSWLTCLQSCSSSGISDCSGVTYKYTGLTTNPTIQCSYRRGRITPDGSPYGRVAIAIVTTLPSSSTSSLSSSPRTSSANSSSSAPPQTVTYTYLSSYPVTYTTSYVTTAISTAPGSTVISTYVTTAVSTYVTTAPGSTITSTLPASTNTLTTTQRTTVSSYGVTTTAPGTYADDAPTWRTADYRVELKPINDRGRVMLTRNTSFDRKNHCANHNCINSASIDHYPDSANDRCLYFPLDNPGHRDLYNAVFLSLHIYPCQHSFWLYYHGNFGSLSDDHPNITPSVDCREHRLFNDCIYPNSIRTNSGFDGHLYHKLRFDLSDIMPGDNNLGQHRARLYRHD
ncbi:hypothetical protein KC332_g13646 [Hortaea werneckii]|nr:hypothetical protein KC358_g15485 [Hortaea werneckii]KAI6808523.1 hypothetical protein KC350_g13282 [Hortaea werneckii]KAI6908671.1 hypothetical protein KC348_g13762 [Hortaea werneckii]KAI6925579.1 hypothetical protein KC341_g13318 [Hortaea werneckii]KAI6959347.1 hypothetical protein KC321_g13477 [Hortaea werneckii]